MPGLIPIPRAMAAALLMLALADCAPASHGARLSATRWEFARIDGQRPISDAADMRFDNGQISVLVGCNRISGPWRIFESRLLAGPLVQTELACPAPAWDQEKAVSSLLAAAPRMRLEKERLILQSGGHSAELVRADD